MSVVVVRAFPAPGHRAEVIAAQARSVHPEGAILAGLRSASEGQVQLRSRIKVLIPYPGGDAQQARCDCSPAGHHRLAGGLRL